ncbi:VOC family protein [Saccharothrix variisporea]|uniref:Glyoxalase-like protein n=1 Tax=Saccharothrix variisporea TaxID=543527 RepID=A0A495XJN5_9PSEU|nr:VOC family protein [Saccharothrix variisporea]RKT73286.1 glyoxalase-like protein [Saccharothrix variisporea]
MNDIHGFHHAGLVTRDLDAVADRFQALGFTLSPTSRHLLGARPGEPPVPGCTANRCALFGGAYIELLGIVDESAPDPWRTKEMGEGFRLLNFDTDDPAAVAARLTDLGLSHSGVLDLARDVDTAEGERTIRARAVHVDPRSTPEGYLGFAQHLTREYVHQPRYLDHPNGAFALDAVLVVAADDAFASIVERYALLLGATPSVEGPRTALRLPGGRLEVVRASDAERVLPGEPATTGFAALTILVDDLAHARRTVETIAATTSTRSGFLVSARDAFGAGIFFATP